MKIGDRVEWKSQSGSFTTVKRGSIVAIVPIGIRPDDCLPAGFRCNSKAGYGMYRGHESYLIQVDGKGRSLYWPRVKHLHLMAT